MVSNFIFTKIINPEFMGWDQQAEATLENNTWV